MTSSKGVRGLIFLICALLLGGVYQFFIKKQDTATAPVTIGTSLMIEGTIQKYIQTNPQFPAQYTHILSVGTGIYGLRSKTIPLADYTGTILIKGVIVDYLQDSSITIIDVDEVLAKNKAPTTTLAINKNFYYDPNSYIGIDLSQAKGYTVVYTKEKTITIQDTQSESLEQPIVLTLQPFFCKKNDPIKDCDLLLAQFSKDDQKTYKSSRGLTRYNLPESTTRVALDIPEKRGYFVSPENDQMFNTFIDTVTTITPQKIADIAVSQREACKNNDISLENIIQNNIYTSQPHLATVTLEGSGSNGLLGSCIITVALGYTLQSEVTQAFTPINTLSVFAKKENALEQQENENKNPENNAQTTGEMITGTSQIQLQKSLATGNGVTVVKPISGDASPIKYLGRLQHASVRGYTLYYSKKGIRFFGNLIDNSINLGIPNISCNYKISIMPYTSTGDTADVEVYECKGNPSPDLLEEKGYILAGSTGSLSFIIQYPTDTLKDLRVKVE